MSGLTLTVLAYGLVWLLVCGYMALVAARVAGLSRDLGDLRSRLSPRPDPPSPPVP